MTALTVIIDPGNFSTKYVYRHRGEIKVGTFHSIAHVYEEMDSAFNSEVKRVCFKNFDFYIGKGAARFHTNDKLMYKGNTRKGHHEGIVRIIAALHEIYRETGVNTFNVVTTSPYESMQKDRIYFERMLGGKQESYVNGDTFDFSIENFRVAAEGLGAIHFAEVKDCIVVDAGSMTMNILYLIGGSINSARSTTINGGTNKHKPFVLADNFSKACPDVDFEQTIYVTGGHAVAVAEALKDIGYENAQSISLTEQPAFYVNVVGLFLTFEKKFEALFA